MNNDNKPPSCIKFSKHLDGKPHSHFEWVNLTNNKGTVRILTKLFTRRYKYLQEESVFFNSWHTKSVRQRANCYNQAVVRELVLLGRIQFALTCYTSCLHV